MTQDTAAVSEYLTTNDAAKLLGKARETVLYYERTGRLEPIRTQGGIRLFRRVEVERLAQKKNERSKPKD